MPGLSMNKTEKQGGWWARTATLVIGPWNFAAGVSALFIAIINNASLLRKVAPSGYFRDIQFWQMQLQSVAILASLYVSMRLANALLHRVKTRRVKVLGFYVCVLAIAIGLPVTFAVIQRTDPSVLYTNMARLFVSLIIINVAIGVTTQRIKDSVLKANQAAELLSKQRTQMLMADETTKREVANYLHDHVQAGLVVATTQLVKIANSLSSQKQAEVNAVISELEEIRRFDVRRAGRQLSPDLKIVGLASSLEELGTRFQKTTNLSVIVNASAADLPAETSLALYRIAEQALLNAVVHGAARNCVIRISVSEKPRAQSLISLIIENDGQPLNDAAKHLGTGTAIIDAWVSKFDGSWTLANSETDGVVLTALLKLNQ